MSVDVVHEDMAAQTGKISRLLTVYESSLLTYPACQSLVGTAAEAPQS